MHEERSFHWDTDIDSDDECSAASFHLFFDHETDNWDSKAFADSTSRYGLLLSSTCKDSGASFCNDSLNMSIHVATMLQESLSDLVHNADSRGALGGPRDHQRAEQEAAVETLKQELRELLLSEELRDRLEVECPTNTSEIVSTPDRSRAQKQRTILKQKDYLLSTLFKVLSEIEDLEREKRTSGRGTDGSLSSTCRSFPSDAGHSHYPSSDFDSMSMSSFALSSTSEGFDSIGERERRARAPAALTRERKLPCERPGSDLRTRVDCDLDSALYDDLKCSASLYVQDKSPKRPQRRGSFN
jgi:hypothetical protein